MVRIEGSPDNKCAAWLTRVLPTISRGKPISAPSAVLIIPIVLRDESSGATPINVMITPIGAVHQLPGKLKPDLQLSSLLLKPFRRNLLHI